MIEFAKHVLQKQFLCFAVSSAFSDSKIEFLDSGGISQKRVTLFGKTFVIDHFFEDTNVGEHRLGKDEIKTG